MLPIDVFVLLIEILIILSMLELLPYGSVAVIVIFCVWILDVSIFLGFIVIVYSSSETILSGSFTNTLGFIVSSFISFNLNCIELGPKNVNVGPLSLTVTLISFDDEFPNLSVAVHLTLNTPTLFVFNLENLILTLSAASVLKKSSLTTLTSVFLKG